MKISEIKPPVVPVKSMVQPLAAPKKESFTDILAQIEKITQKKEVTPQELLGAQVKCHQYQLQVEMVSKCAEGASTTLRKLQQGG